MTLNAGEQIVSRLSISRKWEYFRRFRGEAIVCDDSGLAVFDLIRGHGRNAGPAGIELAYWFTPLTATILNFAYLIPI